MVVIITKSDSIKEINRKLKQLGLTNSTNKGKGGIDTSKFCGTINFKEDHWRIRREFAQSGIENLYCNDLVGLNENGLSFPNKFSK